MKPILLPSPVGKLRIWDDPSEDREYVIGADVAEGRVKDMGAVRLKPYQMATRDDRPDYSTAVVIDLQSGEHVASWHGDIEAVEYATVLAALGLYFNGAILAIEVNGPGLAVIEHVHKVIRYPRLYQSKVWNRVDGSMLGHEYGWRTTAVTRPLLIARIQEALGTGALVTQDKHLVRELRTMVYDPRGVPRAMNRDKDDRVLALGIALQARFERLHAGRAAEDDKPAERLRPEDRKVWAEIKERRKRHDRNRNIGSGPSGPVLDRPSALPRIRP